MLQFRLEPCGQPAQWYLVEDGGEHTRPILQCVSRMATAEEVALWLELHPEAPPIESVNLNVNPFATPSVHQRPRDKPIAEQVSERMARLADRRAGIADGSGVGSLMVDEQNEAGDTQLSDDELEKLTAPASV